MRRSRAGRAAGALAALGLALAVTGAAPSLAAAAAGSSGAEASRAGPRATDDAGSAESPVGAGTASRSGAANRPGSGGVAEAPGETEAPGGGNAAPMERNEALSALASAEAPERRLAVLRLADIALAEDTAALVRALRDEDEGVRALAEQALWALWGRSGDPAIDARLREGSALMGDRQLDESIAAFTAIISERPDFAEAWNKRATALYLKGDYRASMADCAEVDRRNPWHFGMMAGMGQIWLRLGNLEKAEGWFARALEVNPNMTSVAALLEATRAERHRRGRRDT